MAGGRMPTCELALLLCGASSQAKLEAAIKTSFEHHAALEQVRKYDDHAPPHAHRRLLLLVRRLRPLPRHRRSRRTPAKKRALLRGRAEADRRIAEIDGRFVDSHELGKPYGTAMALLSLKLATEKAP